MDGACTTEGRRAAPRRKHPSGNLYQCHARPVHPPASLLTVGTVSTEHMTWTIAEKIPPLEKAFWGDTSLHFFLRFSLNHSENQVVKMWILEVCFYDKSHPIYKSWSNTCECAWLASGHIAVNSAGTVSFWNGWVGFDSSLLSSYPASAYSLLR